MFATTLMSVSEDLKSHGVTVTKYSGRGMYGNNCIAITGPKAECLSALSGIICQLITDAEQFNADEVNSDARELFEKARNFTTIAFEYTQDTLGRDVVLYWPEQQIEEEAQTEATEDDK